MSAIRRLGLASLRVRLLLLVLVAILPAFGLILYTATQQRRDELADAQEAALRLAQMTAAEHERVIEGARQLLLALAQLPAVRGSDPAECTALLTTLLREDSRYANLGVITPSGEVVCSGRPLPGRVNLADRPYFRRALETRGFAIGEYQVGRITRAASVNFGYPVLGPTGRVRAVVFAALDLAWLNQVVAAARLPEGSTLTVLDRSGTILVAVPSGEQWVGRSLAGQFFLDTVVREGEGVVEASILDGPAQLLAFTPLRGAPDAGRVYLSIGIPKRVAVMNANRILVRGLGALAVVAGLALVAAWVASDVFVLRRVTALVTATRRLAAGDLSARIGPRHGGGELGQLSQAFDEMAEAISSRQRALEVLFALDQALAQATGAEDVARIAAEHVVPLLGFDAAAAFLLDRRGQVLRLLHAHALPAEVQAEVQTIPVGAGVAGRAVAEQRPVVVSIEQYPGDAIPQGAKAIREAGYRTLASTPFLAHGHVYGALTLASRRPLEASDRMVSLLASVGTQIGVTVSHVAERERAVAQDRLAALGRLAAGVAHELKNPVSVVAGRVELLRSQVAPGGLSDKVSRSFASLQEAVTRIQRIMAGLSIYSKPPKPAPQTLSVPELLAATQELVAYAARKNEVTVVVDAPSPLPLVSADRSQLMQVLLNLATNAIEAMTGTGGQLTLRARTQEAAAGAHGPASVAVEIADTGPGIPAEVLPRIWEAFYTTKSEGTGLGLSIVRSLIDEQPGAAIEVDSRLGEGTTFVLTLPTVPAAEPE